MYKQHWDIMFSEMMGISDAVSVYDIESSTKLPYSQFIQLTDTCQGKYLCLATVFSTIYGQRTQIVVS